MDWIDLTSTKVLPKVIPKVFFFEHYLFFTSILGGTPHILLQTGDDVLLEDGGSVVVER